jgi:hypothetical protein
MPWLLEMAIKAKVLRDGKWGMREAKEIVPGDIIPAPRCSRVFGTLYGRNRFSKILSLQKIWVIAETPGGLF